MEEDDEFAPEVAGPSGLMGVAPPVPPDTPQAAEDTVHGSVDGVYDHWIVNYASAVRHYVFPRIRSARGHLSRSAPFSRRDSSFMSRIWTPRAISLSLARGHRRHCSQKTR